MNSTYSSRRSFRLKGLFFCTLSLLFIAGCSLKSKKRPNDRQTFRLNLTNEPVSLDPRKGSDLYTAYLHFFIYEGLTCVTSDSMTAQGVAEHIEVSDDGLTYTFELGNHYWSDGIPITSNDFIASWKSSISPDFPCSNAYLFYPIKNAQAIKEGRLSPDHLGVYALSPKVLQVKLEKPTPHFLQLTTFSTYFPIPSHSMFTEKTGPVPSNGPFKIAEWKNGSHIHLVKNPFYWNEKKIELSSVHISLIKDEMTAYSMFRNGELDIIGSPLTDIPIDALSDLKKRGEMRHSAIPASTICSFNLEVFPFNHKKIRKAFALAINRKEITDNIWQKNETPATNVIPPNLWGGHAAQYYHDGDIQKANELLDDALQELDMTRADLEEVSLLFCTTSIYPQIAQAIQQQWIKNLGVKVKIEGHENKIYRERLEKRNYQIAECIWMAQYIDPMNIFERFTGVNNPKNYPGFHHPQYEKILKEASYIPNDTERFAYLKQAEEILIEEVPLTVIYHWNCAFLSQPWLKNIQYNHAGGICLNEVAIDTGDRHYIGVR